MFGLSGEHLLILGVVILFFGPRVLPQLGSTLGKTIRSFREHKKGILEPTFKNLSDSDDDQK